MLHVMRKYEKYIYLVITVIIVISFSFFGTYGTINERPVSDPVVFTTVNGNEVTRSTLEEMVRFLETDNEDKLLTGGAWGPNFFNDGVIKNDIIDKKIASLILTEYQDQLKNDLESRFAKEKVWKPYEHPQAKFINFTNLLGFASPDAAASLATLQKSSGPFTPEAINARIALFQAHRRLPAGSVYQVLKQQEKMYDWVKPDPNLSRGDLSLFGYTFLEEWFGPKFTRLSAEFVINAAEIAKQRGYKVSKAEALADLTKNAELSFRQLQGAPQLGVATPKQYFEEQMRRMGLDQARLVEIWQQVMLFRRLFDDVGTSVVVDSASFEPLWSYYNQDMKGNLYSIPQAFRFSDSKDLEKFEVYLSAVSDHKDGDLSIPETLYKIEDVQKKYPELVEQSIKVETKEVSLKALQAKVSIKQMWEWEGKESSWNLLKAKFPELAQKTVKTPEERLLALDGLDNKTRIRVDTFAREKIVEENPKWIDEVLDQQKGKEQTLAVREKGGNFPFEGVKNPKELIDLLMKQDEVKKYTGDKINYYTIKVLDRTLGKNLLTFQQASHDGTLDALVKDKVKDQPVDVVFAPIFKAIEEDYNKATGKKEKLIPAIAASLRFYSQARHARELAMKNEPLKTYMSGQFQWDKTETVVDNESLQSRFDATKALSLKEGEWTDVIAPASGFLQFFELTSKETEKDPSGLVRKVELVQQAVRDEAKGQLAEKLLNEMMEKKALSVEWMQS